MGRTQMCGRFGRLMCLVCSVIICAQVVCAGPICRHPHDNGKVEGGVCTQCPVCSSGWGHSEWCGYGEGADAVCTRCEEGAEYSQGSACLPCTVCSKYNRETKYQCRPAINAKCGKCMKNFFNDYGFEDTVCTHCKFKPWHPDCADYKPDPPRASDNYSQDKSQADGNKLHAYSHTQEEDGLSRIALHDKLVISPDKPRDEGETNKENAGKYVGIAVAIIAFFAVVAGVIFHQKRGPGQCRITKKGSTTKLDSEKEEWTSTTPKTAEQTRLLEAEQNKRVSEENEKSVVHCPQKQEMIVKFNPQNPENKVNCERELKRGAEPCAEPEKTIMAEHDGNEGHGSSQSVDFSYAGHAGALSLVNPQNQSHPTAPYYHPGSLFPTSPQDTQTQNQYEDKEKYIHALILADNIQVSDLPLEIEDKLCEHLPENNVRGDVNFRHLVDDLKLVDNLVRDNLKEPRHAFKHMKTQRVTVKRIMAWLHEKKKFAALKVLVDWCMERESMVHGDGNVLLGGIQESGDNKKEMAAGPGNPVSLMANSDDKLPIDGIEESGDNKTEMAISPGNPVSLM